METRAENVLSRIKSPIIITDSEDRVIFKNPFAKKIFPTPRKGSSIIPYIDKNGINILNESHTVAMFSLFGVSSPYRRAVVFISDATRLAPGFKFWFFDISLHLLLPDNVKSFLAGAEKSVRPRVIALVNGETKADDPSFDGWAPTIQRLSNHFFQRSDSAYAAASFSRRCSTDYLVEYLNDAVFKSAAAFNIPVVSHYETDFDRIRYVEFCQYVTIFLRTFVIAINQAAGKRFDVRFRKDSNEFSTIISYNARLPEDVLLSGSFKEFYFLFPGDKFNISLLEAMFIDNGGYKFSFEADHDNPFDIQIRFDVPASEMPGRLTQNPTQEQEDEMFEELKSSLSALFPLFFK